MFLSARHSLLSRLHVGLLALATLELLLCAVYLAAMGRWGRDAAGSEIESPSRFYLLSLTLFVLLEIVFYSLIYCHGRETSVIVWHLLIIQLTSIILAVWGIKESENLEKWARIENTTDGTEQQFKNKLLFFDVIVYLKVAGNTLYLLLSLLFRCFPLFFASIFRIQIQLH